ncbi:ribosome biogenesis GTPase YqeH [Salibacterium aidingense]|uniref:ribosome biogenesis GTPase YqeH n=1 Tax=Salibacterium aidingense TaxID=384933 RepID=UPI0004292D6D|nr:ribosome biogenesis GTPase YqeH [Salibacterium aidingense]
MDQSRLICAGCGAPIQTEDPAEAGYTPPAALERDVVICQRCFRLNHYNEIQEVPLNHTDFTDKLHELGKQKALIVKIIDVFDIEGSWIPGLQRYIGGNDVLLLVNKMDLLPKSINENKLKDWVRREAKEQGLQVEDVLLISAEKKKSVAEAAAKMDELRKGKDVYITGCTNVGKSTFINALIQEFSGDEEQLITTSRFPGTTLDLIDIPLDDGKRLYDTPGIINEKQIAHYVTRDDLKKITPAKEMKPRVYQLEQKQTLFIAGLARFDFVEGERNSFVAYFDNHLRIHRTKLDKADQLYKEHKGGMLSPPETDSLDAVPEFVSHHFQIKNEKTDVVISGLGWITVVNPGAKIIVHAPKGAGVAIREAII